MLGLAGEIVKADRHAQNFLDRCTSGAEQLLGYLDGSVDGVRKDAAWSAEICGLDADGIRQLARRLVDTRSMLTVSWNLQRAHHGEQPFWAALGLASVIGQIGLPGGGVGSVAIAVLSKLGYHVIASTGRTSEEGYLKRLGAAEIIDRNELSAPAKPLAKERWAGGVDSVGSTTLANLLAMTKYRGAIAVCGLAGGMDLPSSVAPFILRGVCLLGIDSVMCPIELRKQAWARLSWDLDPAKLSQITTEISLHQVIEEGAKLLGGQVRGRTVIKIEA